MYSNVLRLYHPDEDVKVKTHLSFANNISVFAKEATVDQKISFYDN